MSLPKAQLVDPQGNMNLPGMTATGIVTATSLSGVTTGSATGLTGNPDLDVGIVTASSFVGQGDGHAANLTGTPQLSLGIATATSFVGDATGKAAGLTGTPNLNVGLITATSFVGFVTGGVTGNITGDVTGNITGNISGNVEGNVTGDVSGLARGLGINGTNVWTGAGTSNLGVGVCTAIQYHGDGSNLTGAGSSAYIAQEITATGYGDGGVTVIDLSKGNLIYYKGESKTTVGFASTAAAEQITFIRDTSAATYDIDMDTASVDFDAGEYLTQTTDAVLRNWFDQPFTVEYWIKADSLSSTDGGSGNTLGASTLGSNSNFTWSFGPNALGQVRFGYWTGSSETAILPSTTISTGTWYHLAFVHDGNDNCKIFIDGVLGREYTITNGAADGGTFNIGKVQTANFDGKISNLRITHQALYYDDFIPPTEALTTTSQGAIASNVKLLCCQSSSDDTAATVTPNTISANGTPTPGSETITQSGTVSATLTWPDRIKWNNDTSPTLFTHPGGWQVFHFTTFDTGLTYNGWSEAESPDGYGMYTMGYGSLGRLGLNNQNYQSSPTQVGSTYDFTGLWQVTYGGNQGIFQKNTNDLFAAGYNSNGSLGQNDRTGRSSPIQIPGTWVQATVGENVMMGSKSDNTFWVWGQNNYGQLGHNNRASLSSPTQLPAPHGTWSTSDGKTCIGNLTSYGIDSSNQLYSWGRNFWGNLGHDEGNPSPGYPGSRSSPTQIGGNNNWNQMLHCDVHSTSATKTDGTLWAWGYNGNGQLGKNNVVGTSSPTQVGTDTTWSRAFMLNAMQIATKTDGTLWAWGNNTYGSLGQNDRTDRSSPTQIPGTWTHGSLEGNWNAGAFCKKTDGTLWCWGENLSGQLGLNTQINYSSPVQVPSYSTNWLAYGRMGGSANAFIK